MAAIRQRAMLGGLCMNALSYWTMCARGRDEEFTAKGIMFMATTCRYVSSHVGA